MLVQMARPTRSVSVPGWHRPASVPLPYRRQASSRRAEQAKVDVAYSHTNVKLIGISGGVSYGALGMTHHSATDIATMGSIPAFGWYFPSDQYLAEALMKEFVTDSEPSYIRIGRNAVEDVYDEGKPDSTDKVVNVQDGTDLTIIACGELVYEAKKAMKRWPQEGNQSASSICTSFETPRYGSHSQVAKETKAILTALKNIPCAPGAMVAQLTAAEYPTKVRSS